MPAFMLMHEFMRHQVQLLSYLDSGYICQTMELPTAQEKSKQIFFAQPKAHQFKFTEKNKTVSTDPLWLIAFFKQCQTADKAAGILDMIKEKKQPKEKKIAHLPIAGSHNSSYWQHCCKNCNYHQSNHRNHNINDMTVAIEMINATITLIVKTRTTKTKSPMRRRMTTGTITSRKRVTRSCTTTSPLHQAWTLCPE
jgi:hypothetical protein